MTELATRLANLSPEKLALLSRRARERAGGRLEAEGIPRRPPGPAPLSFAQERLWFIERLGSPGGVYNVPAALRLRGVLDAAALGAALAEVVRRHEVVRAVFRDLDGVPVQVTGLHPLAADPRLPLVDLAGLPAPAREDEAGRLAVAEVRAPFDLARGPLLRARLIRLADALHLLQITVHHVVCDGWSMGILLREMATLYAAFSAAGSGRSLLPELPVQYADFAAWQRERLQGERLAAEVEHWRARLAGGGEPLRLPADRPRPASQSFRGGHLATELPEPAVAALRELCRGRRATLFMGLLAAFTALLHRVTGEPAVAVGAPVSGRVRVELEGLIGLFVNTLVLRTGLDGDPAWGELVERVRDVALDAESHQELPFEKLVEALQPERSLAHAPLFQVMFNLENGAGRQLAAPGLELAGEELETGTAKFDLSLLLVEDAAGVRGAWEYAADLFDRPTVTRLAGHLAALLAGAAADPGRTVSDLPLLQAAERHQLLAEWNDTAAGWPAATVHGLIEARVDLHPERPAVDAADGRLSYRELDRRANRLARQLMALGVRREDRVGVCLSRGLDLPVALLAVLKAGAAYVPLDPAYPRQRLALVLEDAGAALLLTEEKLAGLLAGLPCPPTLLLDRQDDRLDSGAEQDGGARPGLEVDPAHLAYVLFTSGSTGRPKGVEVHHRGVAGLLRTMARRPGLGPEDALLAVTTVAFDIAALELFLPLLVGSRVVLAPRAVAEDGRALSEQLAASGATALQGTPSTWRLLLESGWQPGSGLAMLSGGEALTADLAARLLAGGGALWNLYGPTETSIWSAVARVEMADLSRPVTVGRPVADTRVVLLDARLRPVPVGVPGELCIGGVGVARGYSGRPDLTAERFVPDPYSPAGEPGARLYRTGDLARWRGDGALEVLGRLDHQVKVRGYRIEAGEVEAALRAFPRVRGAVVAARDDGRGSRLLAAWVECDGDVPAGLRAALAARLPDYMIPSVIVPLAALPLTPNGKVDRAALPEPGFGRRAGAAVAPRTAVEQALVEIWREVLGGSGEIGVEDDFFQLGGHSLLATRVTARVAGTFGVELPLRRLFETPTVAGLAEAVSRVLVGEGAGDEQAPPLVALPAAVRVEGVPLSFAQERLWFLDRLEPESPAYNLPAAVRLEGPLRTEALGGALGGVVRRHEALRTRFVEVDGRPVQRVDPEGGCPLPVIDLAGLPEAVRELEALGLAAAEARRPFGLEAGPLLRAALLRLAAEDHVLLLTVHHVASDAWSTAVLVREVAALYGAAVSGVPAALAALPVQYGDFAVWQRGFLAGEALERRLSWWRGHLADGPPALELPVDRPRGARRTGAGGEVPFAVRGAMAAELSALARQRGATPFLALLAVFAAALHRWTGQGDLAVGTPVANRAPAGVEGLIGFFVNTLALRVRPGPGQALGDLLAQVRAGALGAYAHQDLPFEKLVAELHPERDPGRTPLFQAMLALQNVTLPALQMGGLRLSPLGAGTGRTLFDLTLELAQEADGFSGILEYDAELFERATVLRMAAQLGALTAGAVGNPERPLGELPLLSAAERHQVRVEWNDTGRQMAPGTLAGMLRERAAATPAAPAAVFEEEELSYTELVRRGEVLARHLRDLGVGPEVRVGILLERSLELPVAIAGAVLAGGAFVPLDPEYPAERLGWILEDCGAAVVVTRGRLLDRVAGTVAAARALVLEEGGPGEATPAVAPPHLELLPENAAYVLYTSGSTGRPKGAVIAQGAVTAYCAATVERLGLAPGDRILQFVSPGFDVLVGELFPTWLAGGTVVLCRPERLAEPAGFLRLVEEERLTGFELPTAYWHEWVDALVAEESRPPGHLRFVATGTERVSRERLEAWSGLGVDLVHVFGLTETTVTSAVHVQPAGWRWTEAGPLPIGRPLPAAELFLLDGAGRPVGIGVRGEVFVGGVGVGRGYLGRPELTAERFVPDGVSGGSGARLYRTGDAARLRWDGALEFLGRLDRQLKVRGYRIEPGEIEAALEAHPGVREAVVEMRRERGLERLVGYVVPAADGLEAAELKTWLRERLPEYMVPSAWVELGALPLTAHGKVDRRGLPAPEVREAYVAPRDPVEETLAGILAEVLALDRVGAEDDFFALGGHSLLAAQVIARAREAFGVELPLRSLFEAPSVAGLAAVVEAARREGRGLAAPPLRPVPRGGDLPLSFAQQRLWFLDRLEPGSPFYNIPAALRLVGDLRVGALARALAGLAARHEVLRSTFPAVDSLPVQRPGSGAAALPLVDLAGLPAGAREAEAAALADAEARRPFDLAAGPLLRTTLVRFADDEHALLFTLHHIAGDGGSVPVLHREVAEHYAAALEERPPRLPALPVQYGDFAVWQRQWLAGEVLAAEVAHWRGRLAGSPPLLELPWDRPRPPVQTFRGAYRTAVLPVGPAAELAALARRLRATPFMVLLAGFGALLGRMTGSLDLNVGTPVDGRNRVELEGLIGLFVNTLVLRADLAGDPGFRELAGRARETVLDAHLHQDLPFEKLVEALQPARSLSHSPLFQVMFSLEEEAVRRFSLPGLTLWAPEIDTGTAKFDLTLSMTRNASGLLAAWEYNVDLFDAATVARLATGFETLLAGAAADPEAPLSRLPLLGEGQQHQLLVEWADPGSTGAPAALHELVGKVAAVRPDSLALVCGGERRTYGELMAAAAALAGRLRGLGLAPEARVGVCLERGPALPAALLAVLQAGGAYVPLDPAYPRERLSLMLEDSGAAALITAPHLVERFGAGLPPLVLVPDPAPILETATAAGPAARPPLQPVAVDPGQLAYVIYTSGSTGRPKGVAIEHRSAAALLAWAGARFADALGGVLGATSVCFDLSVFEIFTPLAHGGTLVLAENALGLAEASRAHPVTLLNTVPSALAELLRSGGLPESVATVCLAGEPLPGALVREAYSRPGVREVWNLYGPSEDTTYSTGGRMPPDGVRPPGIGRPLAGSRALLLDRELRPVPPGAPAEICLAGAGLARGYLGRPELTAERFVPNPAAFRPGERLYRTGDLGRLRPDGEVEFLGRFDHQVKVRGFRIELGEIEAALGRHPAVAGAVAVVREDRPGDRRLVAYVVPAAPGTQPAGDPGELRSHLRRSLPEHMVPSGWVLLERLPLTPNGKVDRRALPAPEGEAPAAGQVAPRNQLERQVAEIWREVLGVERVGVHDSFFDLGGHSLLMVQAHGRLQAAFGPELTLIDTFRYPTVAALAEHLGRRGPAAAAGWDEARERAQKKRQALARRRPGSQR